MKGRLHRAIRRASHWLRLRTMGTPWIHLPLGRLRFGHGVDARADPVTRETELVIEGFPRSGNTYALTAFRLAQGRPVRVAHHLHAPAQIRRAARLGVPAVVLLREPRAAIASTAVYREVIPVRALVDDYVLFHEMLLPLRHAFVVAPFETVVEDLGAVVERVNHVFGTRFVRYEKTPENEAAVFRRIEEADRVSEGRARVDEAMVARPSAVRDRRKESVKRALEEPALAHGLARAEALYTRLREGALL